MAEEVFPRALGGGLTLRLIRPDDEPRLVALHGRLSQHTAYQRFFTAMRRLPTSWAHFLANVDDRFRAYVLAENRRMLRLLSRDTRILDRKIGGGVAELLLEPQRVEPQG